MPTPYEITGQTTVIPVRVDQIDARTVNGPADLSAANTDILTGTVGGWMEVADFGSMSVTVVASAGITAGTLSFEVTNDPNIAASGSPVQYLTAGGGGATTTMTPGASTVSTVNVPLNAKYVRIRISTAFVGGTVQATATLIRTISPTNVAISGPVANSDNVYFSETSTALAAGAVRTGGSRDTGASTGNNHRYRSFSAFAIADAPGTMRLEVGSSSSTFVRASEDYAVAANDPITITVPVMNRYYRVIYTNGAAAQTTFMLTTAFHGS